MNQASPETFNLSPKSEERVRHIFESQDHTEFWYAQLVGSRHEDDSRTNEELEYSDDEEIESEIEYELIIRLTA